MWRVCVSPQAGEHADRQQDEPAAGRPGFSSKPSSPPSYPRPLRLWPNWTSGTEDWLQTVPALLSSLEMFLEAWVEGVYRIINGRRQSAAPQCSEFLCDFDLSSEREANHPSTNPKNCQKMWTESKDARPENVLINPPTGSQLTWPHTSTACHQPPTLIVPSFCPLSTKWQRVPIILLKAETVVPKTLFM